MKKILALFPFDQLGANSVCHAKRPTRVRPALPPPPRVRRPPNQALPAASPEAPSEPAYTPGYTKIGWYDADGDYYNRDPYKIVYITYQCGSFGALMSSNFKGWASVTNVDYSTVDAEDMDKFYNFVETYAGQGRRRVYPGTATRQRATARLN
jgi:hypothetical protein